MREYAYALKKHTQRVQFNLRYLTTPYSYACRMRASEISASLVLRETKANTECKPPSQQGIKCFYFIIHFVTA